MSIFGKDKPKQYSVPKADVAELQRYVHAEWLLEKVYKFAILGFSTERKMHMDNMAARCGLNKEEYDIDWSTVFKDEKIYAVKKKKPEPKPEATAETPAEKADA